MGVAVEVVVSGEPPCAAVSERRGFELGSFAPTSKYKVRAAGEMADGPRRSGRARRAPRELREGMVHPAGEANRWADRCSSSGGSRGTMSDIGSC